MMAEKASYWFVDGHAEPLCEKVSVLTKKIDLNTGEETLTVKVHSPNNGIPFEVSRAQFVRRSFFDKLTHHGLSTIESDENYTEARNKLAEAERQAEIMYHHHGLGFRELGGVPCFLAYHPIGSLPAEWLQSVNLQKEACLKPTGSFDAWKAFVRKHVVGNVERSLALMIGATAPISHVLKSHGEFPSVPVWALVNRTSSGKSTLLFLIASLFANPSLFVENFNATSNALYKMLEERGGLPFLVDEATHVPDIDWDSMIYTLPTGKEKRRCEGNGKLKPLVEFSGSIIMTSEVSILERSKGHGGEQCRIVEFQLDLFSDEPEMADETRRFCFANYGWATEPVVSFLLDPQGQATLITKYREYQQRLTKAHKKDITGVDRRILARLALILVAGWLLKRTIHCNFDLRTTEKYLLNYFENQVENRDERDDADRWVDRITGYVCEHREMFPTVEDLTPSSKHRSFGNFWGARGFYGTKPCIWVQDRIFKERLLPNEMHKPTMTCKSLHEKGYLIKFYGRYYNIDQTFGGITTKYYCVLPPRQAALFDKYEDAVSRHMTMAELNANVGETYYNKKFDYLTSTKLAESIAIGRSEGESFAMFLNDSFAQKMRMQTKSTLYAAVIPSEKIMIFSKESLLAGSVLLHPEQSDHGRICKGSAVKNLAQKLGLYVTVGHQVVTEKIEFQERNEKPLAVVTFQEFCVSVEPLTSPIIDYEVAQFEKPYKLSQRSLLLDDDED